MSDFVARRNTVVASALVDERAWPLYLEVVADLKAIFDKVSLHPDDNAAEEWRYMGPTSNYWEDFVKLVEADADVLPRLREATGRPRLGLELRLVEDSLDVDLRYIRTVRRLESLLRDHARRALERGEGEVIYQDVLALLSLGEHAAQAAPFFVCHLVGWAMLTEAIELLEEVLAVRPDVLSDEHLVTASERISMLGEGDRFPMQIQGDRITMKTFYDCLFTNDGHGDGRFTGNRLKALENTAGYWDLKKTRWPFEEWLSPALAVFVAGRRETIERADAFYEEIENQLRRPLWQREVPPVYRWLSNVSADRSLESVRNLPFTAFQLLPLCEDELMVQRRDGVLTVIALERFRRRHGAWPTSLDVLTPDFLRDVPRDRFDGEALRYHLVDGEPILYSVGVDRDDDGGRAISDNTGYQNPHNAHSWTQAHLRSAARDPEYDGDWVLWSRRSDSQR